MQSQRCLKSPEPCRIGCPGNDWRVHSHAGQAVPNMLGKFTAMLDIVSQRCRKARGKARSDARQAVPEMPEKLTAIQDSLSQRCLTAMQDSLSQRCLEKLTAMQGSLCQRHRLMQDSLSQSSQAPYPAWLQGFKASLGQPILHGCELFMHVWAAYPAWLWASHASLGSLWSFRTFLGQATLHGCQLFKHLWDKLSCMAVSFSIISGMHGWLWAFQASLRLDGCEAFLVQPISCISGISYPAWLGQPKDWSKLRIYHENLIFNETLRIGLT